MKRMILALLLAAQLLIALPGMAAREDIPEYYDTGNMLTVTNMTAYGEQLWDGRYLVQGAVEYVNETENDIAIRGMTMVIGTLDEVDAMCRLGSAARMTAILYDQQMAEGWMQRVHATAFENKVASAGQSFTAKFSTIIDKSDLQDVVVLFQEFSTVY